MSTETQQLVKVEMPKVRTALETMMPQLLNALPKHITPERMVRVALTAIQNTPKLLECNRQSLYTAILRAAQLGLEPDGVLGQAYLIPFKDQVQFIPGYKGLIDLARRSGEVSNIIAKEVCAKDNFKITWHLSPPFVHEQTTSGDRGEVIGFWAMANFKDGGFHWDYLPLDEVNSIRDNSSGYKAAVTWSKNPKNKYSKGEVISPWVQNAVEMGKKTAIRRIAKYLPMSVQKAAMVEDLVDAGKRFTVSEMGDFVIEPESGEVIENEASEGAEEAKSSKLDTFAGHDPATGEVLEPVSAGSQEAAQSAQEAAKRPAPTAIPMKSMPNDTSTPDVAGWVAEWESAVSSATDADWLRQLRKVNETVLGSFAKRNAAKHAECVKFFDDMLAALTGGQAAA